jgi:hypothetical protein
VNKLTYAKAFLTREASVSVKPRARAWGSAIRNFEARETGDSAQENQTSVAIFDSFDNYLPFPRARARGFTIAHFRGLKTQSLKAS